MVDNKKTYDLLKAFYRTKAYEYDFKDPMRLISMVGKDKVLTPEKEIQFLNDHQIKMFIQEATRMTKTTSKSVPVYRYGYVFVSMIYTGMRIGEVMALQWQDVDFERNTISITKSVENVKNYTYDLIDESQRTSKGVKKRENLVGSTKTQKSRIIHMNHQAAEALRQVYQYTNFKKCCGQAFL